ncbi:MAG: AbrB/MazE/SpoVT family DNA-binding domain-containing protein [Alphaproteobacteria bacterium]|nr:AbrB/MazE/SpoVT family DNA-binding domain-containing protein [Alphaproteobacteria bacterium]
MGEDARAFAPGRTLKLRPVGNSVGVVLPKDLLEKLGVGEGDELSAQITPDHVLTLKVTSKVERQAREWIDRGAKKYRETLRVLSK